jgi:hypothetical protein
LFFFRKMSLIFLTKGFPVFIESVKHFVYR